MQPEPEVTIGIPAYNAGAFLERTIRSALDQTWSSTSVVVSVDHSDDNTAELALALASKWDLEVRVLPRRIGWVANSNAVLRAATSPYMMILPHDDLLLPTYVARCVAALQANREAVVACTDLSTFGQAEITVHPMELRGSQIERVERMIRDCFAGVAYRGVIDRARLGHRLVPDIAVDDFAADTLWVARMCVAGEVLRVPEVLYRKLLHGKSAHSQWKGRSEREENQRWLAHTAEMESVIYGDAPALRHDPRIREAFRVRARRTGAARFEDATPIRGIPNHFPMLAARIARWRRKLGLRVRSS